MDMHHLNCFIEVAKQGSFTKAGEVLHISQPTISKMVKTLEDELGLVLLERTTKQVRLTDAGEIVFKQSQKIINSFQNLTSELVDLMKIQRGTIRLGLPPMVGAYFFAEVLAKFHKLYPLITFQICEAGSKTIKLAVEDGSLDFGVVVLPVDEKIFNFSTLGKGDLLLIVNQDHHLASESSVSLKELIDNSFILCPEDTTLNNIIREECIRAGFIPRVVCKSSQWDFVSELVAANLGVALLPDAICIKLDSTRIKIIQLRETIQWNIGIIWRKNKYLSFASREWMKFTLSLLSEKK